VINNITDIGEQHRDLQFIIKRSAYINRLNIAFKDLLPESIRAKANVINYQCQTLIIGCGSSVWATRIRYLEPILIAQFKDTTILQPMKFIKVKVQPEAESISTETETKRELSETAQESIADIKVILNQLP
jgi:hypothetical protein